MAAIAACADDSAQSVRIAYNATRILFLHTIWTSAMIIWCPGSHNGLRLVVMRLLRWSLTPIKVGFQRDRKKVGLPACLGTRVNILGNQRIELR